MYYYSCARVCPHAHKWLATRVQKTIKNIEKKKWCICGGYIYRLPAPIPILPLLHCYLHIHPPIHPSIQSVPIQYQYCRCLHCYLVIHPSIQYQHQPKWAPKSTKLGPKIHQVESQNLPKSIPGGVLDGKSTCWWVNAVVFLIDFW